MGSDREALEAREDRLARLADDAAQAVRGINHVTITGPSLPAPSVYEVLGSLRQLGYGLEQAALQLSDRLAASPREYDLYEADGGDPAAHLEAASTALTQAARAARELGLMLDGAQSVIAGQGYWS